MSRSRTFSRIAAVAAGAVALATSAAVTTPAWGATATYGNPTTITIPDSGAGSVYPSTVTVAGANNGVTDVNVTLTGLQHTCTTDLDFLLVGPQGQAALFMSDTGDCSTVTGINLTLDDAAATPLPVGSPLTSGTYKPTDNDWGLPPEADEMPAPAPDPDAAGTGSALSVFNGTNPNGVWSLYLSDQWAGDSGQLVGGWSLQISTVDTPATPTLTSPATGSADSDGIITFTGAAGSGTTVQILEGATVVATTTASGTGSYTVSLAGVANGNHTYTARAVDTFSNTSGSSAATTVTVDTVAPGGTVVINSGATRTNNPVVTLTLAATDAAPSSGVTQMRFSNDGTSFSAFEAYATSKAWMLASGDGTKTVWVQFADRAGKVSAIVADSVVLDTVRPKVRRASPANRATGVAVGRSVKATLTEDVRGGTVRRANVKLVKAGTTKAIAAVITYSATKHRITINPKHDLAHGTTYKVTIGTGVKDLAGNRLDQKARAGLQPAKWRFTTA